MPRRPRAPADAAPRVVEVDPVASNMLDILVDLGHLDDRMLEVVNDRLLDQAPPDGHIDLQAVRRVAAEVLWDNMDRIDPELQRVIDEEWGFLFH